MASKKKTSKAKTVFISFVALVIGVLIGYVLSSFFLSNKIDFVVVGDEFTNVGINSNYEESGIVCIFENKDVSDSVTIKYYDSEVNEVTKIDTTAAGQYVVRYTYEANNIKKTISRIINVVSMEDLSIGNTSLLQGEKYVGGLVGVGVNSIITASFVCAR